MPIESELDFITRISEAQRTPAVAIMTVVDHGGYKLVARLKDFLSFFSRENAKRV